MSRSSNHLTSEGSGKPSYTFARADLLDDKQFHNLIKCIYILLVSFIVNLTIFSFFHLKETSLCLAVECSLVPQLNVFVVLYMRITALHKILMRKENIY